jgi:VWFA-related protein
MAEEKKFARWWQKVQALGLILIMICPSLPSQESSTGYVFHTQTEIVLVNVTARDKNGNLVRDLKREDFAVLEDNKPQQIASFDLENTDTTPTVDLSQVEVLEANAPKSVTKPATPPEGTPAFKDRRLLIFFFDLSAMEPDETVRAVTSAQNYVDKQMVPADLVAVVSLGNTLRVNQDFTSDKAALNRALDALNPNAGQGFEEGTTGMTEGTADTANSFTVDDTEFNIFNTDRRLGALRSIAQQLAKVDQKKSLIYFSSGMDRTGIENQSELRAAINAAVRANLSIYTTDSRGLQAIVPGGEAQNASLRGTSPFSGQATLNQYNSNFTTQETLVTLASATGGRAFLDTNDFSQVFKGVQQDTSSYYILGYHSTNPVRDGRYRRITVRVNRPGLKLDFRHGYYAPADFRHSTQEDREAQLEQELTSDLPSTDLPVYLSTGYFRMADNRFYVPVSLIVPGKEIPFTHKSDQDKATLDVLGVVLDPGKHPVSQIRDTVKLSVNTSDLVQHKNVQYGNGFVLPPGDYHLKFVVREHESGRIGSFETDLAIPDLKSQPLKMSSVILASQLQPASKQKTGNPLVRDGSEVIPSVTHVFSAAQHLYLYYEVYDPARQAAASSDSGKAGVHVLTNVAFFIGKTQAYATPLVEASQMNAPDRRATVFQLDVPLSQLKPGFYTCQVNVIDDVAGRFRFPRLAMLVRQ